VGGMGIVEGEGFCLLQPGIRYFIDISTGMVNDYWSGGYRCNETKYDYTYKYYSKDPRHG
jgi:hypothetical protein